MCHKVQHAGWVDSAHAKQGIDCEACHGNGGEYWPARIMKDPAAARAAGLVDPTLESCRRCHPKADDALLGRVHAPR
jgi:hypothetical protein